ncbi:Trypanosome variant surface glycoprotein (A-type)/Trypanosome variant surface glycoprotein C-terminal domain containing protein, putative [Trypanosoma equiperdum]|uniref:Trypanosome variant surface glycoprotein (A-type)/Trypanosome variant surface glycoprotein C-terminal domain containing protein, putative n=1 Tax=Trypanosoma equiperdum TaxID=5694 RepID=A0A1G4I802_TRYEQ|nr:Trypanosome variant surface glycoprotein (A-type)/Trypanosome variant surface glycoprotein C-terminal domain containing protein, putative [Trypanosoma equiperdum]
MYAYGIITAILILLRPADATAKGALSKGLWGPLLTFAGKIRNVPGRATAKLNDQATRRKNIAILQNHIAVFMAAKNDNATTSEFGPIMAALGKLMQQMTEDDTSSNQDAVAAAAASEYLRGAAAEFFNVAAGSYNADTNACLTTNTKNSAAGGGVNGVNGLNQEQINLAEPSAVPNSESLDDITPEGFKSLTPNDGIKDNDLGQVSGTQSCQLFSAGANGLLSTGGTTNTIKFALGYLKRPSTPDGAAKADGTKVGTAAPQSTASDLPAYSAAHEAILKLKNPTKPADLTDIKNHDQLKDLPELRAAIKNLILKKKGEPATSDDAAINKHIADYYTKHKGNFDKFWEKLKTVSIPAEITGTTATPLDQVTDLGQLAAALAFYTERNSNELQSKIAKLQAKNSKTEVKSIEQICKEKEDAETCRQDKNCKFNENKKEGSKCVLSEEGEKAAEKEANQEKGEKDGKTDCARHTTKEACEAENVGLAAGAKAKCGWIDYVDGTGKLPKPECRSSSFLVNKQFALSVVSAAFVALLF